MSRAFVFLISILPCRFNGFNVERNPRLSGVYVFMTWLHRAKEHNMVDHFKEGGGRGVQGTEKKKLHSSECFHYFICFVLLFFLIQNFFFLPRSRFSISDVDFIIRFLKRWYFFQDKRRKTSHYECVSVAGNVSELVTNPWPFYFLVVFFFWLFHLFERQQYLHKVFTPSWTPFPCLIAHKAEPEWTSVTHRKFGTSWIRRCYAVLCYHVLLKQKISLQ